MDGRWRWIISGGIISRRQGVLAACDLRTSAATLFALPTAAAVQTFGLQPLAIACSAAVPRHAPRSTPSLGLALSSSRSGRMRPATARTLRGAARQSASTDRAINPMQIQNANA